MLLFHDNILCGHGGRDTTYQRMKTQVVWPGMYRDVKKYVSECLKCQRVESGGRAAYYRPRKILVKERFELIAMDLITDLPETKEGFTCALVAAEYATRFV